MPRKDIYHDTVKRALVKDGWTITHDQFTLSLGKTDVFADLGAEQLLGADKGLRQIIVEVKSFIGRSKMKDLEQAIGQYILYFRIARKIKLNHLLYLAITEKAYETIFQIEIGQLFLEDNLVRLIVFDAESEVITQWIPD